MTQVPVGVRGRGVVGILAAAFAGAMLVHPPIAAQPSNTPPGTIQVQRVEIIDPNGFERPMPAASILLPIGWRAQGGVVWNPQDLCSGGYSFKWQAVSPDGGSKVAIVPAEAWSINNFGASGGHCPAWPYTNLRAYLEALVRRLEPSARVLDFRPREDLRRQFTQLESTTPMPGGELRSWVESGEVLVGFQENGREMRGTIASTARFSHNRFSAGWGSAPMETLSVATFPGFAASAPAGMLDMRLTEAIRGSVKVAPEWNQRITAHRSANHRIALDGVRKRSEITAQTSAEIRQMQQQSWERQQQSQDRMHREFSEAIREVETYRDPDAVGGTVELSNHYSNAWRLDDGTYVLTDDPSFNPYGATGKGGRRLEAVR